jgi:hypothetical protein
MASELIAARPQTPRRKPARAGVSTSATIWELDGCSMSRSAGRLRSSGEGPRAARPRHQETTMPTYLLNHEDAPQALTGGRS